MIFRETLNTTFGFVTMGVDGKFEYFDIKHREMAIELLESTAVSLQA